MGEIRQSLKVIQYNLCYMYNQLNHRYLKDFDSMFSNFKDFFDQIISDAKKADGNKDKISLILIRLFVHSIALVNFLDKKSDGISEENSLDFQMARYFIDTTYLINGIRGLRGKKLNNKLLNEISKKEVVFKMRLNFELKEWQEFFATPNNFFTKIIKESSFWRKRLPSMLKIIRAEVFKTGYNASICCYILSYIIVIANKFKIDLWEIYDERYLTMCPYCHHNPCECGEESFEY